LTPEIRVSAKKLAVSTHLQYILTALCALLLFVFVRQLSGVVLLTPLFAAVLAALLVLIVSGVGRVQSLEQSPEVLTDNPPVVEVFSEEAEPEENPATGEEASVRDSVEGKR
jgi:TRAP-type C4-dicarboxylate transport system permease large subunit